MMLSQIAFVLLVVMAMAPFVHPQQMNAETLTSKTIEVNRRNLNPQTEQFL